jgi:hypothetical protein
VQRFVRPRHRTQRRGERKHQLEHGRDQGAGAVSGVGALHEGEAST